MLTTFFILVIYFLPTIVAANKKRDNTAGIFVMNFFLGWTFIFWVIALTWAATGTKPK